MEAIDDSQEDRIDKSAKYFGKMRHTSRDGKTHIPAEQIYMYGEVNLDDPKNIRMIEDMNLVDPDLRSWMPVDFNYNKGIVTQKQDIAKMSPTRDAVLWFKYVHCMIGKPKRIIVYRVNEYELEEWNRANLKKK